MLLSAALHAKVFLLRGNELLRTTAINSTNHLSEWLIISDLKHLCLRMCRTFFPWAKESLSKPLSMILSNWGIVSYGVPQNRRRAIFVGLLNGKAFEYPLPTITRPITAEEALSDLPENSIADGSPYPNEPKSDYQKRIREGSSAIYNHDITIHTEQTKRIIAMVPDGGNYKNLPKELQQTRKVHIAWTRLNSQRPSITIDTGHNHHFHYKYNRVPTVRESARLQSFPDTFIFLEGKGSQLRQVGNAVPPLLAKAIAEQLQESL